MENQGRFKFWNFETHKHEYTDEVRQLSATDIKTGRECHHKLVFKFTGHKAPKAVPLLKGIVFHRVIEEALKHKAKTGMNLPYSVILPVFEASWEKEAQGVDFSRVTQARAKSECLAYIQTYVTKALPLFYTLPAAKFRPSDSIEKFFSLKITFEGVQLGLTGKVDFIGRDLYIIDHKTSACQWTQQDADSEVQAQLYPFCIKKLGVDVRGFRFSVVSPKGVEVFEVAYNEGKVRGILEEAFALKRGIEAGNLLRAKSERVCKWCEFNDICKEKIS